MSPAPSTCLRHSKCLINANNGLVVHICTYSSTYWGSKCLINANNDLVVHICTYRYSKCLINANDGLIVHI